VRIVTLLHFLDKAKIAAKNIAFGIGMASLPEAKNPRHRQHFPQHSKIAIIGREAVGSLAIV
jgi:hypothetical protein